MIANQLAAAIEAVRPSQLDEIARTIWKAHAAGLLDDDGAQGLAEAVEARRALGKALAVAPKPAPRRVGSRPRSAASLERRRRWVAAGLLPPALACQFTMGEAAVLAVVALEVQKRGRCVLTVGAIAATAGVGETTVRNALRRARQLGLVAVEERRMTWTRNLSNIVQIISPEWTTWLRLSGGGCKSAKGTPTAIIKQRLAPFSVRDKAENRHRRPLERGGGCNGNLSPRTQKPRQ